jgi:XTP/dITP diphosphohydrolase
MKLCFATNNKHKIDEVAKVIEGQFEIVSLNDLSVAGDLPETQETLEGNALQKATFVFEKTGVLCFADDSGLEVDALGGKPGVRSARYAGEQRSDGDNITLLLKNLENANSRKAQFRTVIALVGTGHHELFEGVVRGEITISGRGSGGFGYDPVFVPDGHSKTFAEMSLEEKNSLSHRSIAVRKLASYLNKNRIG